MPKPKEAKCVACGCTESRACPEGCGWAVLDTPSRMGICTVCARRMLNGTLRNEIEKSKKTPPPFLKIAISDYKSLIEKSPRKAIRKMSL